MAATEPVSATPSVETLYDCAQILSNAKGLVQSKNATQFRTILLGVKGDQQAKRLASQFIARFFTKFPNLANEALDALLDLCEDDDINIRKQAIKDLPMLCRETKQFLPKIADVLSQLLQTDDSSELVVIQNSLMTLFRKEAKGTLIGLFSQIKTGGDVVRDRAINFLHVKTKTEGTDLLTKEAEAHLLEEIKTCMNEDCTAEEFHSFMAILGQTSIAKTVTGQLKMVEMICNTMNLNKPFDPDDEESLDRVIQCSQAAVPFFSSQVRSSKLCQYLCLNVLPEWESILTTEQAKILKILAELCMFTSEVTDPLQATKNVHQRLMEYLPSPPAEDSNGEEYTSNIAELASQIEFTKVECLLFTFHTMGKQAPTFLTSNPDTLKEFKARLQYFALGIQGYIRKLKELLSGKSGVTEDDKLKAEALRSASNINSLIKDLFHCPPSYKTKIVLSWSPASPSEKTPLKRKSITFDETAPPSNDSKPKHKFAKTPIRSGGHKGVYQPPQGKYSSSFDRYDDSASPRFGKGPSRGGGGSGGKFRGSGGKKFY